MKEKTRSILKGILRYSILIIVLLSSAALIYWFYSTRTTVTYESPVKPVEVEKGEKVIIRNEITLSSYIEAEAMIPVVPFVSGTILEYYAKPGEKIKKDDIVAQIDPEPYKLQVSQAKAQYEVFSSTLKRIQSLKESGAATAQQLDEIQAQFDASKAQLELSELQLGYATVKSPVDGTYLICPQAVGDIGNTQSPLAIIADLDNLVVKINVPEKYFSTINGNKDLEVSVIRPSSAVSPEVRAKTEIVSVTPFIDPTTKTFSLKVRLSENVGEFTPGMYVKAEILLGEKECLALPVSARKLDGSVYRIENITEGETQKYEAVYVKLPELASDEKYFEIPEEYKETLFIVRGQNSILSGEEVKIVGGI